MKLVVALLFVFVGLSYQQTCDSTNCMLPNCRCFGDHQIPGGLATADTPQIVMVSFEGTVNSENVKYYRPLFSGVTNPNDCPATGTFFIQDMGTNYGDVRGLLDEGHEIGIFSVDGKIPSGSTAWRDAYKKIISELATVGIDSKMVKGVRAPQLSIGGDDEFIGLGGTELLYDSSCISTAFSMEHTYLWPYTFDYMPTERCDIGMSPTKPFRGMWEVPLADLHDITGDKAPCTVPSGCRNITTKRDAFDLFFNAFHAHYEGDRIPFVMIVDPAWATNGDLMDGTTDFLRYIRSAFGRDVWIVSIYKGIQWIQNPVPIANLSDFAPWRC